MIAPEKLSPAARARFTSRRGVIGGDVRPAVERILREFRRDAEQTIRKLARKYDGVDLKDLEVSAAETAAAENSLPASVQAAVRSMFGSVTRYHKADLLRDFEMRPSRGILLGKKVVPFGRAGLYVPGGRAVYPSCVVMAAAPAVVAGVKELVLCTPADARGRVPDAVLFAAKICGVGRVFKIGGAPAVFAMAYGTKTVPACEIIVGPGNKYVTAAKDLVRDDVAIDFLAGPTEILVLSDGTASPRFVASELVGQAEHDPAACCVLVTTSAGQAAAVAEEIGSLCAGSPRGEIIRAALSGQGALLVARSLDEAVAFSNEVAPEHLSIATKRPLEVLKKIRSAGSVFLGEHSPVAVGDYGAGPNAILPTFNEARRVGGLTANTFVKAISYQMLSREGLETVAPAAMTLARVERLEAHRKSIEVALGR